MGKPDATDEEVIAAAKASHAHSFIKRMPAGYDTVIKRRREAVLSQGTEAAFVHHPASCSATAAHPDSR